MKEKVTISQVNTRSRKKGFGTTVPTLLKFQNGRMAALSKERTLFTHVMKNKIVEQRMVVANGNVYHGDVNANGSSELFDTYMCVRNKRTNQMRILPIDEAQLSNNVYETLAKNLAPLIETNENKNVAMLKQFGGRQTIRNIQKKQEMEINIDVLKEDLEKTVETSLVADDNDVITANHLDTIRPKFNAEATRLEDVYNLNDLISPELIHRLEEEAMAVFSADVASLPISSEFLLQAIETIKKSPVQSAENFLKIKIIIYMDALLKLIKSRNRSMEKMELSGITTKVEWDIRNKFSDPKSSLRYARTSLSSEKALCYFIVLAFLLSEKYRVDADTLAKEVGVPRKKIVKYGQIVNARLQPRTTAMSLALPSKVPELQNQIRRKKRA